MVTLQNCALSTASRRVDCRAVGTASIQGRCRLSETTGQRGRGTSNATAPASEHPPLAADGGRQRRDFPGSPHSVRFGSLPRLCFPPAVVAGVHVLLDVAPIIRGFR